MAVTGDVALAHVARQSTLGPTFPVDTCLRQVRLAFDVDAVLPDAATSWRQSRHKHSTTNASSIPRGVPVYWLGGSSGHGHVAISVGGGWCWSTDIRRHGYFDKVPISTISSTWGLTLVGWTEDINGVIVTGNVQPSTTYGIDASHYQFDAGLDVAKVKAQGFDFIVLKCTQGSTWADPTYRRALAQAKAQGMLTAAYHFLQQGNAAAQAGNLATHIVDKSVPVVVDVEPTKGSSPTRADLIAFRNACRALGLNVTMKYLPEWYWRQLASPSLVGPLALWASGYPSGSHDYASRLYPGHADTHWRAYGGQAPVLWQFASSGKLDGFSGRVDVNAFRGTRAQLSALGIFRDFAAPVVDKPPVDKPPVDKPPVDKPPVDKPPVDKPPVDKPPAVTHKVIQANVQQTDPVADVVARIRQVAHPVHPDRAGDVIGWNELEGPNKAALHAAVLALEGFESYLVGGVGVSWRTDRFTAGAKRYTLVSSGVAGVTPNRYIVTVELTDVRTGKTYWHKVGQSVHHVDVSGKARIAGAITGQNGRARKYFATLAAEIHADKLTHPVVFTGDLNVDYLAERRLPKVQRTPWFPLTVLGKPVARVFMVDQGTHGSRAIDWCLLAGYMRGVSQVVLPHGTSDHNAVLTTVAIP